MLTLNAVHNPDDAAYLDTETVDGRPEKTLHWKWQRC